MKASARVWIGAALIALALLALPFAFAYAGTAWVRIANFAILYVMLALGLNIVVGFAGLLDLGYIAFYAVGAYVYALLASPQFNLHLPFWIILPIGAAVAALFGVILGAPTLKLPIVNGSMPVMPCGPLVIFTGRDRLLRKMRMISPNPSVTIAR